MSLAGNDRPRTYWNICDICDQIVAKAILRADMRVCIPCLSYIEFDEDELND